MDIPDYWPPKESDSEWLRAVKMEYADACSRYRRAMRAKDTSDEFFRLCLYLAALQTVLEYNLASTLSVKAVVDPEWNGEGEPPIIYL